MLCGVGCTYPSIHVEDTLKITVGCLTSAYPSIHVETLRITVGCPLCTYPSIHILTTLKLSRDHGRLPAVHISKHSQQKLAHVRARPPVLSPVPVPSQAIHSRTGLNLHYSDIQSTAQKSNNGHVRQPSSKNSNRTTTRSSPHARRPSIVDTSKTKAQIWAKGPPDKKRRELFITGIFPARNLFFITVLN